MTVGYNHFTAFLHIVANITFHTIYGNRVEPALSSEVNCILEVNYVMERLYRCNICLEFVSDSLQLLITHIGRVHRDEPNFHVVCGIDGCARTFKKFLSLRNHLIRKHNIVRNTRNSTERKQLQFDISIKIS